MFAWYFYFNFSGYSDMAIGAARLLRLQAGPELQQPVPEVQPPGLLEQLAHEPDQVRAAQRLRADGRHARPHPVPRHRRHHDGDRAVARPEHSAGALRALPLGRSGPAPYLGGVATPSRPTGPWFARVPATWCLLRVLPAQPAAAPARPLRSCPTSTEGCSRDRRPPAGLAAEPRAGTSRPPWSLAPDRRASRSSGSGHRVAGGSGSPGRHAAVSPYNRFNGTEHSRIVSLPLGDTRGFRPTDHRASRYRSPGSAGRRCSASGRGDRPCVHPGWSTTGSARSTGGVSRPTSTSSTRSGSPTSWRRLHRAARREAGPGGGQPQPGLGAQRPGRPAVGLSRRPARPRSVWPPSSWPVAASLVSPGDVGWKALSSVSGAVNDRLLLGDEAHRADGRPVVPGQGGRAATEPPSDGPGQAGPDAGRSTSCTSTTARRQQAHRFSRPS